MNPGRGVFEPGLPARVYVNGGAEGVGGLFTYMNVCLLREVSSGGPEQDRDLPERDVDRRRRKPVRVYLGRQGAV
jgi:hypothetical protein